MRPILFEVPILGYKLHAFSLMLVLGAASGVWITAWRARREEIDPEVVYELAVWLLSGGFIGARLMHLALNPETVHSVWDIFKVWEGGIVFYGCIMGGLAGTMIYYVRKPFPFWAMADAVAPALAIGIALGRVGCLLNGCCYGAVSNLPWAMTFPAESIPWMHHVDAGWLSPHAPRSLPVHPSQVYAILDGLVLLAVLNLYFPRRKRDGEVMALLMVIYATTRFGIEALRDDDIPFFAGMTIAQCISAVLLPLGLAKWWAMSRQLVGTYAERVAATERVSVTPISHAAREHFARTSA